MLMLTLRTSVLSVNVWSLDLLGRCLSVETISLQVMDRFRSQTTSSYFQLLNSETQIFI